MTPLLERVAAALISATPDEWSSAELRVEVEQKPGEITSMSHTVRSSEYPRSVCAPTEDLMLATRQLQLLCTERDKPWIRMVMKVNLVQENWTFSSDFEY
jgi:hypothetical protein